MTRHIRVFGYLVLAIASTAFGQETDGCAHFSWDVSHELAVMKQAAAAVTAASGSDAPMIQVDKPYELKLTAQAGVKYLVSPAKPTLSDSAEGGMVRFHTPKAGLYRVSITTGHWIDVVDGDHLVKSKDFQDSRGCTRPHKIVEFELPGNKDLTLQLSGGTEATITVAITPVATAAMVKPPEDLTVH